MKLIEVKNPVYKTPPLRDDLDLKKEPLHFAKVLLAKLIFKKKEVFQFQRSNVYKEN